VACGTGIDLTARGKGGQLRQVTTKLCGPCRHGKRKYKMSTRQLAQRDGTNCGICGLFVDVTLDRAAGPDCPSVDHVIPRARGGSNDPANLQLAHLRCNMLKSDHLDYEAVTT
jgi:5-methylcytosine-specific restriction endonuclease McrA